MAWKGKTAEGDRFGRFIVLKRAPSKGVRSRWYCRCDCGTLKIVSSAQLRAGRTRSCGCLVRDFNKSRTTHGRTGESIYFIWGGIVARCTNQKSSVWKWYGGRGITICDRWLNFENFLADMGERPSKKHSIERIDNDGAYSRENCKWATIAEQMLTRRTTKIIMFDGKPTYVADLARKSGRCVATITKRLARGMSPEEAIL